MHRDNVVELDQDHPGFRDATYRARRDEIARIAWGYRSGDAIPDAPYTPEEHGVWRQIRHLLAPLHAHVVCSELNRVSAEIDLPVDRIPQLDEVNRRLRGFRMEPVAGLITPRVFMETLGQGVFLSTQYIRHHSKPLYTPEPDVVHELVGHAASLLHPGIQEVCRGFGQRVAAADSEEEINRLKWLFWYTLEFGLCMEDGVLKAYGAGLLSSAGELERATSGVTPTAGWDLDRIAQTPYDPTDYQPLLFVAPSFEVMISDLKAWLAA